MNDDQTQASELPKLPDTLFRVDDKAEGKLDEQATAALWNWRKATTERIRESAGGDTIGVLAIVQAIESHGGIVDAGRLAQLATEQELQELGAALDTLTEAGIMQAIQRAASLRPDAGTVTSHVVRSKAIALALAWIRERAEWAAGYLDSLARATRRAAQ